MEYLLLILSLFLAVGKNVCSKAGGESLKGVSSLINLNILTGSLALIVYALFGVSFELLSDPYYILLGILYATFASAATMLNITAMQYGHVAFCSLVFCAGFIITTLYCAIFFHEPITLLSGFGMILLIVSIVAVVYRKPNATQKTSYKFLFFSIPAMICSGSLGIVQKIFVRKYGESEINSYLFISFALILLIAILLRLFNNPRDITRFKSSNFLVPAVIYSAVYVAINKLNLYLAGVIDGVVLFPFMNGGVIAVTAIASYFIFKEKLNLRQWIGTVFCIISILLVAIG